jgi:hypothetical protein
VSTKKRNAPRTAAEVAADYQRAPAQNITPFGAHDDLIAKPPLAEALDIVQHARELEARRGRTAALTDGGLRTAAPATVRVTYDHALDALENHILAAHKIFGGAYPTDYAESGPAEYTFFTPIILPDGSRRAW